MTSNTGWNAMVRGWGPRVALGAAGWVGIAAAADAQRTVLWEELEERPSYGNFVGEAGIRAEVMTEAFLAAHPDLRWRREGLHSHAHGQYAAALAQFQRAARYADKPSQAMVAEMYWEGRGVPVDRPLAYAWMDLAAERMYANFLILRERYWLQLTPAEQAQSLQRGQALLAEYGDDVAKPRLEKVLRLEGRKVTGSRVGFVGSLKIIPNTGPMAGTGMTLDGTQYYAKQYWQPDRYWELQDQVWRAPPKGRVDVGGVEVVRGTQSTEDRGQDD